MNTPLSMHGEGGRGGEVTAKPPPPVPATTVTLAATRTLADATANLARQTGIAFDLSGVEGTAKVSVKFDRTRTWEAVETLAEQTGSFVGIQGGKVKFTRRPNGVGAVPSGIEGPFRVVLKKVIAKRDLEFAGTEYELHLEVQWEPRFPVLLIDAEPKATAAVGREKLAADPPSVRTMPTGYTHAAVVRVKNVPREAKQIDELTGSFRLVAAAKVLAVEFTDLTADKPVSQTTDGVTVTLHPAEKLDKGVRFRVDLAYPEPHPEFESYQSWHGGNTFRLFAPSDRAGLTTDKYSTGGEGRRLSGEYTFTGPNGAVPSLKGWRVVYDTPGPMSEQTVTFTLKGVLLP